MYTMETERVGFVLLCVFDTRSKHNNRSMLRCNSVYTVQDAYPSLTTYL